MNASAKNLPHSLRMTSSGFTLIELMVTIAVLAIIVGIAAPSISTQLANQRVKSTAATLANALKEAKVESIIRRQNITVLYDTSNNSNKIVLHTGITSIPSTNIASYNVDKQSVITQKISPSTETSIAFQPNKKIVGGATVAYTICDSGSNSETPKQVKLTNIANVNTISAGSC
ncbi:Tfp pilus assembly protein FimT/FimU [Psychrobacter sp. Pi2-51]|uniref:pilus assembly FimT family protein n=1 Tax=Psychrobacter sp. Pi2-51 TaxID=2774132 RepID=UPI001D12EA58|nr:prepilin-type N-terminal cleavage/methylation domain-containing protein [Psychrobacter sp. Pi2-51]